MMYFENILSMLEETSHELVDFYPVIFFTAAK